jgi:hypothetical protein
LPLPKMGPPQVEALTRELERRGFGVRRTGALKVVASRGLQRIAIDGSLGLASSSSDMLDAVAPSIPTITSREKDDPGASRQIGSLYFRGGSEASSKVQFLPRLESMQTWSSLRKDGLCGITPDEGEALRLVLGGLRGSSRISCVTGLPRNGSAAIQIGRRIYFESELPVSEFLSSLQSLGSPIRESPSFLPRDSVIKLRSGKVTTRIHAYSMGEWCCIG